MPPPPTPPLLRPMTLADLEPVYAVEQRAYSFPWSRGNLHDSLQAGHAAWLLEEVTAGGGTRLVGYLLAMHGFEEMHLLNITVAPEHQGQGHGRRLLAHLLGLARQAQVPTLWLEVRESNHRARRLYESQGYVTVGLRKAYYPAAHGQREAAMVMTRSVDPGAAADALD